MLIKKKLIKRLFLFAVLFILSLTLIADPTRTRAHVYNFIPLHTITYIIMHKSLFVILKNMIGNVILFLPFGFLLPLRWSKVNTIYKAVLIGSLFSIFIEMAQIIYAYRMTDIDDVLLNTLGTAIGYKIYQSSIKKYKILDYNRSSIKIEHKKKISVL
ncbi:VanZ family protein [Neobacillus cucumis]|uniref:VanZ-like domain-containing protein n=1 Tax=Neobacillus cucumis TaxID=1740721 RepID=A0A2N5H7K3_9BACI|nr:VanZ family protein [Neobacillus cucumis]PLS01504.1 hypothetical protein CVD27_24925 [Neobacillus cucumis]